jgi:hypothetical protein
MIKSLYLEPRDVPDVLRRAAARAFPTYTGRKYRLDGADSVPLENYWDGGSRTYLCVYRVADDRLEEAPFVTENPFNKEAHGRVPTRPGYVFVEHVIFCGKDLGIRFVVHPDDLVPLLPAPAAALPLDQRIVLVASRCFKSSYGGDSNVRFTQSHERTGISLERWNVAKVALVASGHLNKAGAVTTKGRNAEVEWSLDRFEKGCAS